MHQESRKSSPSPEMLPRWFFMWADAVFHCLSFHSFVCSVLLNTQLPFTFPSYILLAHGLCSICKNEGEACRPSKNSSSQFSTWLCSLREHISSWSTDHLGAWTKNLPSHPPVLGGRYILINSHSVCPIQRIENIKFIFLLWRLFLHFIEA